MFKNNATVFSDSALNNSLKEQGLKGGLHGSTNDTETESRKDNAETTYVQIDDLSTGDEADGVPAIEPVPNAYVGKRNYIHKLMDVAFLMANVSQMKALLATEDNDYFLLILTFISLSIFLQIAFTICMMINMSIEKILEDDNNSELSKGHCPKMEKKKRLATWLDRVGSIIVLFIIVFNVFIAGFGIENHKQNVTPQASSPY